MAEIKPLNQISKKWKERASQAGDEYRQGVENPRRDWAESTADADAARREGLAAADARNAFVTGVRDAGTTKWKERAIKVGPARYRQGVNVAEDAHRQGYSRYHNVISGLNLPPRGPKGSPENLERVRAITEALHAEKTGQ